MLRLGIKPYPCTLKHDLCYMIAKYLIYVWYMNLERIGDDNGSWLTFMQEYESLTLIVRSDLWFASESEQIGWFTTAELIDDLRTLLTIWMYVLDQSAFSIHKICFENKC